MAMSCDGRCGKRCEDWTDLRYSHPECSTCVGRYAHHVRKVMRCDMRCLADPQVGIRYGKDCETCSGKGTEPDQDAVGCDRRETPTPNVIHVEGEMAAALKEVIYSYAGRVSVAQVIGVLEIVKWEVGNDA